MGDNKIRVLVADDDKSVRDFLSRLLNSSSVEVVLSQNE